MAKRASTSGPLSSQRYASLVRDLKRLAAESDDEASQGKVLGQWNLGERIERERIADKVGYHNSLLRDLSADTSISIRSLQYAVAFRRYYKRCPKDALTWAHYLVLLDRPTVAHEHYRSLAIAEDISARELLRRIRKDAATTQVTDTIVPRPSDGSFVYRVDVLSVIDGDTLDLRIDLGFHTDRRDRFRLADIDAPEISGRSDLQSPNPGRAARDFVIECLSAAKTIAIQTHRAQRVDLHGRYVAHIFYAPTEMTPDECFKTGTHLNNELCAKGHAQLYVMA